MLTRPPSLPRAKTLQLLAKPNPPAAAAAAGAADGGDGGDGGELLLQHSHQLYKWHSDLQAAMSSETEHQYSAYAAALQGHLTTADDILAKVKTKSVSISKTRAATKPVPGSSAPWRKASSAEAGWGAGGARSARIVGDAPAVEKGMGEQRAGQGRYTGCGCCGERATVSPWGPRR